MNGTDWLLAHEPAVRLGFFVGVFALMAVWELVAPRPDQWLRDQPPAVVDCAGQA